MTTYLCFKPANVKGNAVPTGKTYDSCLEATRSEVISSLYLQLIVSRSPNMTGILTEIFTDELN